MTAKRCLCFIFLLFFIHNNLNAEIKGKIDAGPACVHIDVLESNHTIKKINLPAIKAESTIVFWKGLCLKPSILYGLNKDTDIFTGGLGIGHYTPITPNFSVTPSIGCSYTQFKTTLHVKFFDLKFSLKEKFYSISPYGAIEATYCFAKDWRICGLFQYSFSRTRTTISGQDTTKSHPKGPNYALILEHDLNANWSINIAGGYNISLTKEKHGLRAYGARIAMAYWF